MRVIYLIYLQKQRMMRITDVYIGYLKIIRTLQIMTILSKHGFKEMIYHSFLGRHIRKRRINHHKPVYTTQERLRLVIEDLGPTYIKFGQILADRPDILPAVFRKELKKLQSDTIPFDDNLAIHLIEDELGAHVNNIFSEFNPKCIASASIGQVYTGKLLNGDEVVIKIRRPNIDQKIKLDLHLMRYVAKHLTKEFPEMEAINIIGVVSEFGESIFKELNYYNEATNILRFREIFRGNPRIYIPYVNMKYSTNKMLIMERIYGIPPNSPQELREAGLDPVQVSLNGSEALLKMIFKEGFFHADPHAGNIFILPDNRIALIDFGMVGALRPREMEFLANISIGFARRDSSGIADAMIHLCNLRFFDHRDDLIFNLQQMLNRYTHISLKKMNYSKMIQECIDIITKHNLHLPIGIFLLAKSLATIQKVAEQLNPDIPFIKLTIPYAKDVAMTQFSARKLATELYQTLKNYSVLLKTAPADISEILYKLKQGKITHDLQFSNMEGFQRIMRNIASRLAYSILLVGLFIGSISIQSKSPEIAYGKFLLFTSSILIFIVIIKWIFRKKL